jgi:hypothetical protein
VLFIRLDFNPQQDRKRQLRCAGSVLFSQIAQTGFLSFRMQYCTSSQAKSWIFSSESLAECKRRALTFSNDRRVKKTSVNHVRKFASGFHKRVDFKTYAEQSVSSTILTSDQDTIIQFHAHHIQFLIGPNAILHDLQRSERALSTAIIFFRRFYLSNSIIEISPRKIAVACAFFAAKVEEERVEVCGENI